MKEYISILLFSPTKPTQFSTKTIMKVIKISEFVVINPPVMVYFTFLIYSLQ